MLRRKPSTNPVGFVSILPAPPPDPEFQGGETESTRVRSIAKVGGRWITPRSEGSRFSRKAAV